MQEKWLNGYIIVQSPDHPKSFSKGWYFKHILIVEKHLERRLETWETVHHINEIKTDNSLDNLFVCSRIEHDKAHDMKSVSKYKLKTSWSGKECIKCGQYFYGPPYIIRKRKRCSASCKRPKE
jgi:hypothetical protein